MNEKDDMNAMTNEAKEKAQDAMDTAQEKAEDALDTAQDHGHHMIEMTRERSHDVVAKAEKMPDSAYLGTVVGSIALSMLFFMMHKRDLALFVGLWPPTLLNLTLFLKQRKPSREMGMQGT